jgi:hypothetical protein
MIVSWFQIIDQVWVYIQIHKMCVWLDLEIAHYRSVFLVQMFTT